MHNSTIPVWMLTVLNAFCHCRACQLVIDPAASAISSSICHCTTCRSLSGAPFIANIMLEAAAVKFADPSGATVEQQTSKQVRRVRCATCFSPLLARLGSKRVVLPLSLLDRESLPTAWKPVHHIWRVSLIRGPTMASRMSEPRA